MTADGRDTGLKSKNSESRNITGKTLAT